MAIDVALAALKFLAILTAGLLGVIGLLVDFKKGGKVTVWGRRALVGTIISTIVAVSVQSVETYKQNIDRKEENERNAETLHEIRRGLYLIKDAEFDATIRISDPPDEVKAYLKRINPYILKLKPYAEKDDLPPGLEGERDDEAYILVEDKNVLPQPTTEPKAYWALMKPDMVLRIFKDPTKSDSFWKSELTPEVLDLSQSPKSSIRPRREEPDLELDADPPKPENVSISVGVSTGNLLLRFHSTHAAVRESWRGQLVSIPDLAGARLSVELRYGDNDDAWIDDTLRGAKISGIYSLQIGANRIPVSKVNSNHPGFVFDADFPSNEDALWRRPVATSPKK